MTVHPMLKQNENWDAIERHILDIQRAARHCSSTSRRPR